MDDRLELQSVLETVLGSKQVYFQPPSTVYMSYPAIVYQFSGVDVDHADNKKYRRHNTYDITLILKNQSQDIIDRLLALDYCQLTSHYIADNLYHYKFKIFF